MKKLKIALASFFAGIIFAVMPIAAMAQKPGPYPKTPCKDIVFAGLCTCYLAGEECEYYPEGGSVCICAYTCVCAFIRLCLKSQKVRNNIENKLN